MCLKSIFPRIKERGVSQTELTARMKVSRLSVSKVLHSKINITFASAIRFAKALRLDFFPQLVQPATGERYASPTHAINIFLQWDQTPLKVDLCKPLSSDVERLMTHEKGD